MAKTSYESTYVTDVMIKEVIEKFARLIKTLGINNTSGIVWCDGVPKRKRPPTTRFNFEVEFSYILNELDQGPQCLRNRLFEDLNQLTGRLIETIKLQSTN